MRYETLALVREMHSASVPSSIYSPASVVCVCVYVRVHTHTHIWMSINTCLYYIFAEKGKGLQREPTDCRKTVPDLLSSSAWHEMAPPLIPCINSRFIFCHHGLHGPNDVMTRPTGNPAAGQSLRELPEQQGRIKGCSLYLFAKL